tara:strand:- start:593 stop:883 length:291 start_codon:yes stop_codon:yes gene_type:complete
MGAKVDQAKDLLKKIMKQIAGEVDPDEPLVPEYCIKGKGLIFCYDPSQRSFVKVTRGTTVYVIYRNYDLQGRSLIYTYYGDVVCIDPDELFLLGLD